MTLALKALISSALAGLLGLDSVQAGQFLLSRPALVGPLLGWLNGCPLEGAKIGILLELLYIDFIPVGGVVPPNGTAAAAVGVLAHAAGGLAPSLAFFIGVAAGVAYSPVEYRLRAARSGLNALIEAQVAAGDLRLRRWLARALVMENAALAGYVLAMTGLAALLGLLPGVSRLYPGADFAYSLMPWLGLSGLYFRFRTQIYKKG
ncbi:MAG: PTS sugar transporter subunit IIC [Elusimicrobiales bacterium]|nr:PTS sugar transporter subunit IIC [Elusimicrobiales bacterium]